MNLATIIDAAPRRRRRADQPRPSRRPTASCARRSPASAAGSSASASSPATGSAIVVRQQLVLRGRRTWPALGAGLVAVPLNPLEPAAPSCERELAGDRRPGGDRRPVGPSSRRRARPRRLPALEHVIDCGGPATPTAPSTARRPARRADPVPLVDRERRRPRRADVHQRHRRLAEGGDAHPRQPAARTSSRCQAPPGRPQRADDVVFGVLPLFHIFGLNVVLGLDAARPAPRSLLVERFDPASALEAIAQPRRHRGHRARPPCGRRGRRCPACRPDALRDRAPGRLGRRPALDPRCARADRSDRFGARPRRGLRAHRGVAGGHVAPSGAAPPAARSACRCPASRSASSTPTARTR